MSQRRRSHSSIAIPILLMIATVLPVLGSGRPGGNAVAQMGQGRDPMGGAPPAGPAPSPPATQGSNGAPGQAPAAAPPFDLRDPEVIKEGSTLFFTTCTICHKRTETPGVAGAAPTLRDTTYEKDYLYRIISEGPPSKRMPAWKYQYSSQQIWKLVAYILTFKGGETK